MAFLQPGQPVRKWLSGPAFLYGLIVRLRYWSYRRGWCSSSRLPCRVVSVGNLTVGGTGKTPIVILLTQWLQAKGQRVAVLSRGYKRTSGGPHLLVSNGVTILAGPSEAGDEPFLIARRCPNAIVAVGTDRAVLGRWVLAQHPVDCMILDDGFQHLALRREIDVVLLDATDADGLDAMTPAGRLREPLQGLARATAVVVTRADSKEEVEAIHRRLLAAGLPCNDSIEIVFKAESCVSVLTEENKPLEWCRRKRTWLVSGIGNSESFRRSAMSVGVEVVGETVFRDHYRYDGDDVRRIRADAQSARADIVMTTEKDAGKLSSLLVPDDLWWALRVRAEVVHGEERLRRLVLGDGGVESRA
ncbi:MAG: tetraacyldisaccharide 4'-kinase [Nitrospira sp.]|nr:tetraacyldisaccharide 4'-kinase [Nitrospira sp.]MDH4235811.1 tetraacyldisaccharide 4'-kinase [Nitrospira sp.]